MRFYTKGQRGYHPHAHLIPEIAWFEIFTDNSISDVLISWMSMPYEELKERLIPVSHDERNKAWIAIVCSHLDVLKYLEETVPEKLQEMITSNSL